MKTHSLCALATILVITLLIPTPSALAQSEALRAEIPFDFYVADRLLPAGIYIVEAISNDVLRFRDPTGKSTFLLMSGRDHNREINRSRLRFRRYGDTSFLTSVYWAGHATGRVTGEGRLETELAKKFSAPASIVVAGK